jgi:hypothetical protein
MEVPRQAWVRAALLAGVVYFLIGRVFAFPTNDVRLWRLAAWALSFAVYATHIGYEHYRLRNPTVTGALHVAVAVAIGAFLLAVAGMIHSLSTASRIQPTWLLALALWPAVTAVPAFVGALVAGTVLARVPRRADSP